MRRLWDPAVSPCNAVHHPDSRLRSPHPAAVTCSLKPPCHGVQDPTVYRVNWPQTSGPRSESHTSETSDNLTIGAGTLSTSTTAYTMKVGMRHIDNCKATLSTSGKITFKTQLYQENPNNSSKGLS